MMGEILAYLAGRSAGRASQRHGVSPPATPRDIKIMRALAIVFVICAVVVVLTAT